MAERRMPFSKDIEHDPVHLAAADWFVRLQSTEVSLEETLAWQAWLGENSANAEAFARIEEISQALRDLPAPAPVPAARLARDRYDASIPIGDWKPRRARRWTWPALSVAASFALFFALVFAFWKTPAETTGFETEIGENRSVTLSDGSIVALGGDTRIEVALSEDVRAIELTRGEALFKVAKDAARPFKVRAGDATIIAVGTEFNVERDSDRAVVSVTEGRVVVKPVIGLLPASLLQGFKPKLRSVRLSAGQQTTADRAGIEEPTKMQDPATGWQIGHLAFRLQPLRYVLEDVNRYAHKPIVLETESMGALVITGTVERENIGGWVKSLEHAFDLQATEEADQIVLRAR
ncbi:MAG TPA: FecR domain-containing protein [Steroidobacteraceae bacterium]|jgi:transmembrane sensor|nr:FecR domain-containing protein [Steroidobacteraceae bacterium]